MVQAGDTHRGSVWSFVSLPLLGSPQGDRNNIADEPLSQVSCLVFVGLARGRGASPVEMLATPFTHDDGSGSK